jgi:bla regulator protein BlaR1
MSFAKKAILAATAVTAMAGPIAIAVHVLHAPITWALSAPVSPSRRSSAQAQPVQQSASEQDWQAAAGGKMAFEVASIKLGTFVPPSFPLDGGDAFVQTGGRFIANFPLSIYIMFAYKYYPSQDQRSTTFDRLPGWISDNAVRYTIEAKAPDNATKDQMRLMMQSLLADRFHLAVHFETQQGRLLALTPVKPGKPGPKFIPHSDGPPCELAASPAAGPADVWPVLCGSYSMRRAPDGMHMELGSRNTTMRLFAAFLSQGGSPFTGLTETVVDQTGLSGSFDFTILVSPPNSGPLAAQIQPDPQGPSFLDVMRDELGLKLEPTKGPIPVLVIDHAEKPSEN